MAIGGFAPSVRAEAQPAQAEVPNSGQAVVGDGQFPTATALGPASAYANREWSMGTQNNQVYVSADNGNIFGSFKLIAEQTTSQPAQPVRRLFLNMPSAGIANYRCDYGPEDPAHASNKNYARLGAQISVFGGKAQLLCFQRNASSGAYTGYQVYTPTNCMTITGGPHYVVDGRACVAEIYQLNKTQLRRIAYNQPFSLYVEADSV